MGDVNLEKIVELFEGIFFKFLDYILNSFVLNNWITASKHCNLSKVLEIIVHFSQISLKKLKIMVNARDEEGNTPLMIGN